MSRECPDRGKCHGPLAWCDQCGDVDNVCHDESRECMSHFCGSCRRGPTSIMDYTCDPCRDQEGIEDHEQRMIAAVERDDERMARYHALAIERFNRIEKIDITFARWDGLPPPKPLPVRR